MANEAKRPRLDSWHSYPAPPASSTSLHRHEATQQQQQQQPIQQQKYYVNQQQQQQHHHHQQHQQHQPQTQTQPLPYHQQQHHHVSPQALSLPPVVSEHASPHQLRPLTLPQTSPINNAASYEGISPIGSGGGGMHQSPLSQWPPTPNTPLLGGGLPFPRRKAIRAAQACDACRQRKAKCDEGRPSCSFCKEVGQPCVYREVPPPKQDRTLLLILERLGNIEGYLAAGGQAPLPEPPPQQAYHPTLRPPPPPQIGSHNHGGMAVDSPNPPPSASSEPLTNPLPRRSVVDADEDSENLLSMPYEHTTGVHNLLQWPSIAQLLPQYDFKGENYAQESEFSRGMLNIFGAGDGRDEDYSLDSIFVDVVPDSTPDSRPTSNGSTYGSDVGGRKDRERIPELRLDRQTIEELLQSYLVNMHVMHPILDRANIVRLTRRFDDWCERTYSYNERVTQHIPHSIQSSLVLLVLSLGAVCLHRTPVPGPVSPVDEYHFPFSNKRLARRNIDAIPGLSYFAKALEMQGTIMGGNGLPHVQAGLLAGLYWGQLGRVMDSWRWISWACMGCQVLLKQALPLFEAQGDQLSRDLVLRCFWSCLQLESDVLAELDLPTSGISRLTDTTPLPLGISEGGAGDDDPLIWMYYLAQIALRRLLNRVHSTVYKAQHTSSSSSASGSSNTTDPVRFLGIVRELDFQLEQWRLTLPEPLRWDATSDPPPSEINAARLRAKFFGARYIVARPFLNYCLHSLEGQGVQIDQIIIGPAATGNLMMSPSLSSSEQGGSPGDMGGSMHGPISLEETCRKCLDAAVQSTRAFHGFGIDDGRACLTNIFGTAHAQFGNLLVLQAAYQSPMLRHLVDPNVLSGLMERTSRWLESLVPISAALRRDLELLRASAETTGLMLRD